MIKLFDGTDTAPAPQAPQAEEPLSRGGLPGAEDLSQKLRAVLSGIEAQGEEKAAIRTAIALTQQKIEQRQKDLVAARDRVAEEKIQLALASDDAPVEQLESEKAAGELERQIDFLKARVQGLSKQAEQPTDAIAAAQKELQELWTQLRASQLQRFLEEYRAVVGRLRELALSAMALREGFYDPSKRDQTSGRWDTAIETLSGLAIGDPGRMSVPLFFPRGIGRQEDSWPASDSASALHTAASELAAAVRKAASLAKADGLKGPKNEGE